jgi:hypothetical protein
MKQFDQTVDTIDTPLRAGEWVQVRSAGEIGRTLDAQGALDGLPFMPEMLEYCGRRIRVLRPAEKTCVEVAIGDYAIREFRGDDVVLLEGLRCSGADHDGCQRACMFFWKMAWLRRAGPDRPTPPAGGAGAEKLGPRLKTMSAPGRYFCQSTELAKATQPLTRARRLLKCIRDVRSGAVGVFQMCRLILVPLWRKTTRKFRRDVVGTLTRTPVGQLELQPGEVVEVKSIEEIARTLDQKGRNRGLQCYIELKQFGGKKFRVRNRLDRMISELTGEMRKTQGTVILEDNHCLCANVLGGCPRLDFTYWREVWLERINEKDPTGGAGGPKRQA